MALVLAAACGGSQNQAIQGEYTLLRTTESELPALMQDTGRCRVELTGGSITVRDEQRFDASYEFRRLCIDSLTADPIHDQTTGELRVQGDTIHFLAAGRSAGSGLLRGDTLRVAGPVHTLLYLRQPPSEPPAAEQE